MTQFDLNIDFFLSFNVEKCNMIAQEWEKFMKREGEKVLDVLATRQLGLVYLPSVCHQNIPEMYRRRQKSLSHHKRGILCNAL